MTNKSQISISNDPNRFGFSFFKIIEAFGILNFGHAQRRRLRRVLLFV
jgi:hypothetical protein